jgi:hypothetical protein
MSEETIIYENDKVKITNLRAIFDSKTYSIANITAVETDCNEPSSCLPFSLLVGGIVSIVVGIMIFREFFIWLTVFGIVLVGLFILVNKTSKTLWEVSLTTSSGEVKACISPDQDSIEEIVEALNTAIVKKG